MVLGVLLFAVARRKTSSATASQGSVSVGNNNSGQVVNINHQSSPPAHSGGHGLTLIAIFVEVVGIAVTLWHAFHLTAK
jgi:hypothetical protein